MMRQLVTDAYAPVWPLRTCRPCRPASPALDAALALIDRADTLLVWPIDERMGAWITVVVTCVATGLVVRFVAVDI